MQQHDVMSGRHMGVVPCYISEFGILAGQCYTAFFSRLRTNHCKVVTCNVQAPSPCVDLTSLRVRSYQPDLPPPLLHITSDQKLDLWNACQNGRDNLPYPCFVIEYSLGMRLVGW